jgi:hypothetical protein
LATRILGSSPKDVEQDSVVKVVSYFGSRYRDLVVKLNRENFRFTLKTYLICGFPPHFFVIADFLRFV